MKQFLSLFLLALAGAPGLTQTPAPSTTPQVANWYQIANEGDTIQSGPTATLQACGSPTACTAAETVPSTLYPLTISWASASTIPLFGADPLYGTVKKIGVVQTCSAQVFMVTPAGSSAPAPTAATVTVPPLASCWVPICTSGCTVTNVLQTGGPMEMRFNGGAQKMFAPQTGGLPLAVTGEADILQDTNTYTVYYTQSGACYVLRIPPQPAAVAAAIVCPAPSAQ